MSILVHREQKISLVVGRNEWPGGLHAEFLHLYEDMEYLQIQNVAYAPLALITMNRVW